MNGKEKSRVLLVDNLPSLSSNRQNIAIVVFGIACGACMQSHVGYAKLNVAHFIKLVGFA